MSEKSEANNPERCSCCTCGYTWVKGQHGGHSCATVMGVTIANLKNNLCHEQEELARVRARLAKYEDAEGWPVGLTHDQAELVGLVRDLALRSGKAARPLMHAAALGLESQAREIERLKDCWQDCRANKEAFANNAISLQNRIADMKAPPSGAAVCWVNDQQLLLCRKSPRDDGISGQPRNIAGSALPTDYCNTPLYARAALSAPSHGEQVRVPEGFVLVPDELCVGMREAGKRAISGACAVASDITLDQVYAAMLAAAPSAGSQGGDV